MQRERRRREANAQRAALSAVTAAGPAETPAPPVLGPSRFPLDSAVRRDTSPLSHSRATSISPFCFLPKGVRSCVCDCISTFSKKLNIYVLLSNLAPGTLFYMSPALAFCSLCTLHATPPLSLHQYCSFSSPSTSTDILVSPLALTEIHITITPLILRVSVESSRAALPELIFAAASLRFDIFDCFILTWSSTNTLFNLILFHLS